MAMHPAVIVTTSLVGEVGKSISTIAQCKKEIHAINAQLVVAEQRHQYDLQQLSYQHECDSQKIKKQAKVCQNHMKSLEKDKESLRKQLEVCTQRAMDFSLTAEERAEARDMAIFLSERLDSICHDQLRSQAQLGENLSRVGLGSGGHGNGCVIDADFEEI